MAVLPIPGTEVVLVDSPRPVSSPTDTGQALFVGEAERGPLTPLLCKSLDDFSSLFGSRQSYSYLYDSAETFFREGGSSLYISRAIASSATSAAANLADSVPATTLVVTAKGPGAYGNNLKVIVLTNTDDAVNIPSGSFQLQITESGVVVETSPVFADKTTALNWAAGSSKTFALTSGVGTGNPVRVASPGTALSGGNDQRGSIADADFQTALDRLTRSFGPGQVAMPGHTSDARHVMLANHAQDKQRHALLDMPDTATTATVIASAQAADSGTAANKSGRWASAYWPWAVVPGLSSVPFSTRLVPWSAVQAGLCARVDAGGNPNVPVAGVNNGQGAARWATGLSQSTTGLGSSTSGSLNDNGVNIIRMLNGVPTTDGNRTLRTYTEDPLWLQASSSRLAMAIVARARPILQRAQYQQIDGKGILQAHLQGELAAMLGVLYDLNALYGDTPQEAYHVVADSSVNPPDQIALGNLKASLSFKATPGADRVTLEIVRVGLTQGV